MVRLHVKADALEQRKAPFAAREYPLRQRETLATQDRSATDSTGVTVHLVYPGHEFRSATAGAASLGLRLRRRLRGRLRVRFGLRLRRRGFEGFTSPLSRHELRCHRENVLQGATDARERTSTEL